MSDWNEQVKAAEAGADALQAAEHAAEESFKAVQADAREKGVEHEALNSEEFREWMAKRRATDDAWGKWATLMDAKPTA
jgi:hypothetical protein